MIEDLVLTCMSQEGPEKMTLSLYPAIRICICIFQGGKERPTRSKHAALPSWQYRIHIDPITNIIVSITITTTTNPRVAAKTSLMYSFLREVRKSKRLMDCTDTNIQYRKICAPCGVGGRRRIIILTLKYTRKGKKKERI